MNLQRFIERPVLSTVISIIIVILGILGLTQLPVTQYPDIAPPTVRVSANYPGANAETILQSVIIPIEEQINGVEGMTYMTSTASNAGSASIQVFFEQGYDPDIAAVNVQNRVARANALLPAEVIRSGVVTTKQQNSALMYAAVYSTNPEYDDVFIQNYLNINVKPELQRIKGVGDVNVFGAKDYSMRVWLDPDKMAAYKLMPSEVITAINGESLEAAAGSLGQNSGQSFEYVIKYKGRYKTAEEYGNIVIKALGNGQFLRVKDVAKVELDALSYSSLSRTNGYPSLNFGIFQTPGSNAQDIIQDIYKKLDELKKDFPDGMNYVINYDTNKFLTASIKKVKDTLLEAFLLVFIVVFIFLQDFKSTLIPAIAVPVSIIGTFFFLNLFGYSINLLTLFALVLAIGIVVDDAIVVVEAVHAKLEGGSTNAKKASVSAMSEISGAIVSITLVMMAVFIPVTFIKGPSGVFYEQFGITLVVAILISAINALTLTPALCALFLKPYKTHEQIQKKGFMHRFHDAFNTAFKAGVNKYGQSLKFLLKHRWISLGVLAVSILGILLLSRTIPTGFVPSEDRGVIFTNIELPPGSSLDRSYEVTNKLYESVKTIKGVKGASFISGFNFFSGAASSNAMGFIMLDDWDDRSDESESVNGIIGQLFGKAAMITDANIIFFAPPSVPGFGSADGFEMQLLDRTAKPLIELNETATTFVRLLNQQPEISYASNSFNTNFPQLQLDINVERATESGISTRTILAALQGYIGGNYVADFSKYGKQFRVFVQALPKDRINESSLNNMFVRTPTGEMTPISQFVTLSRVYGPQNINRFNLFNSVTVNGGLSPGYSTGDAIARINALAAKNLPEGYSVAYSGITREEIASSGQSTIIFLISILFVYFLLSAQYESYLLPLAVIFS
ncbi:MAG: efflux RND transporter permease subunit, partial [Flavobacteriaceae bacterium]|nr:efflux RND transporter permease subunit [Flavobacteriaceae bacterium]